MKDLTKEKLAFKLSAILLQSEGFISVNDICAIPFLDDGFNPSPIIDLLLSSYNASIEVEKISNSPILDWEEKIVLNSKLPNSVNT